MNYQKTYKREIRDKDLKGMDEKSKLIIFKILGIPKDVEEYIITVQQTEFWTNNPAKNVSPLKLPIKNKYNV